MTTTLPYIQTLIDHIVSECTPIDPEERFDAMLDECYDFYKVGGPFQNMQPSSVLKECDPTGYRCGVNDYADGESWVEIAGDYYETDEVEKERAAFLEPYQDDLSSAEEELVEAEDAEEDESTMAEIKARIEALEAFISLCEKHAF